MSKSACALHSEEIDKPVSIKVANPTTLQYITDTSAFLTKGKDYQIFEVVEHWKADQFVYRGNDRIWHRITREFLEKHFK